MVAGDIITSTTISAEVGTMDRGADTITTVCSAGDAAGVSRRAISCGVCRLAQRPGTLRAGWRRRSDGRREPTTDDHDRDQHRGHDRAHNQGHALDRHPISRDHVHARAPGR